MSDEKRLGVAGTSAGAGYVPMPSTEPAPEEPKVYSGDEGTREAANDLSRSRQPIDPVVEVKYRDHLQPKEGDPKYSVDTKRAAHDLSEYHRQEAVAAIEQDPDLNNLGQAVDEARAWWNGQQPGPDPQVAPETPSQAQREAPQPHPVSRPANHIPAKLQEALQDPESRAVLERDYGAVETVKQEYANAVTQAAQFSALNLFASFPELSGLNASEIPVALSMMQRQNPQRHAEVQGHLGRVQTLYNLSQQTQAQQAQIDQHRFGEFVQHENAKFEAWAAKSENPETLKAAKSEALNIFRDEYGISQEELKNIYQTQPLLHTAAGQRIILDAIKYRLASRSATSNPSRASLPPVQKPGIARDRADYAEGDVRALANEMRKSSGLDQMRAGVKLLQAQRAARSR